jgi:hypothetical protein
MPVKRIPGDVVPGGGGVTFPPIGASSEQGGSAAAHYQAVTAEADRRQRGHEIMVAMLHHWLDRDHAPDEAYSGERLAALSVRLVDALDSALKEGR